MAKREESFAKIVLDAVDDGIGFLDERGKEAMYYQVEKRFDVSREEIPEKLEVFHSALEGLFAFGAKVIEFQIVRSLYDRLGLEFKQYDGWTLKEYVKHAEQEQQRNPKARTFLKGFLIPFLSTLSYSLMKSGWLKLPLLPMHANP